MSENACDILFRLGKAFMEITNVENAIKVFWNLYVEIGAFVGKYKAWSLEQT